MIEKRVDLWEVYDRGGVCCITTNGFTRSGGTAVMGRGVALQARNRFPDIEKVLGRQLIDLGNHVQYIGHRLFAFPVKAAWGTSIFTNVVAHQRMNYPAGTVVPGWALKANIALIERSLRELRMLREVYGLDSVYLPRPGCGAGGLDWEDVRPMLEVAGDWLVVIDR